MTYRQPRNSDNSLSPFVSDDKVPGTLTDKQAAEPEMEEEKGQESEVPPVPELPDGIRRPRVGRRPVLPTKADIAEHFPLHLQYRDWCEHCVSGKARLAQHRVEPSDRERLGVTFNADYAFMAADKESEEGMQPTLVM